jgi:hypothetical protein
MLVGKSKFITQWTKCMQLVSIFTSFLLALDLVKVIITFLLFKSHFISGFSNGVVC